MNSISALAHIAAARPPEKTQAAKPPEAPEQAPALPQAAPQQDFDKYSKAAPQPSAGLYHVGSDEDGSRQIFFDVPAAADEP